MRIAVLGGGGFRTPVLLRAIAARREPAVDEVVLYDLDPRRLAVVAAVLGPSDRPRWRVETSLSAALTGADVVFSAIRVGGTAGRARDERRALRHGVLGQETVGAAGLAYALRTLPVVLHAARLQRELAPDSWLINFTNPAGLITQALRSVLDHRVIGICDSPVGLVRHCCAALGIAPADATADYVGINHLGWLRRLLVDGVDALPRLLADDAAMASFEEGRLFGAATLRAENAVPNEYLHFFRAARELTAQLQGAPTRGEILAAEQESFFAAAAADPAGAGQLWAAARNRREETYLAEARSAAESRDAADLVGGGYTGVALDLTAALTGGSPAELIVNTANAGAFPQLPDDLVIETGCRVDATGARPVPGGPLTLRQLGLLASVRASESALIDAVRTGSLAAAVHAVAIHPLVGSEPIAAALLREQLADEPELAVTLR